MPERKFVFSELFAFGAGVAVGANWPRASNIVGFILQRLGFELTDLALWMWDPEKSAVLSAETTPVEAKAKRAQARLLPASKPPKRKMRSRSKKKARSPGRQSDGAIIRAPREKATDEGEPWIRPAGSNGAASGTKVGYIHSRSTKSANPGSRVTRTRTAGTKPN
jgi:hypothetical protein